MSIVTFFLILLGKEVFDHFFTYIVAFVPLLLTILYIIVDSEQKKHLNIINEKDENLKVFFESIKDMLFVMNDSGVILHYNSTACDYLGYSKSELIGEHIFKVHYIEDIDDAKRMFQEVLDKTRDHCSLPLLKSDSSTIEVDTRIWQGIWNSEPCIFCLSRDITGESLALDKFSKVFNNSSALMSISSVEDRVFLDVNKAFEEILGYTREEVVGKKTYEVDLYESLDTLESIRKDIINNGKIYNYRVNVKKKNGEYINGICSAEIIYTQGNKILLVIVTDNTEQVRVEEALKQINEQFNLAVRGSNDGIWDWNLKDNSLYLSDKWKSMIGYDSDELSNHIDSFNSRMHPDDVDRVQAYVEDYFLGKFSYYEIEFRLRHKKGHYIWVLSRGEALRDDKGLPYRMAGSHTDITARKNMEMELIVKGKVLQTALKLTQDLMDNKDYQDAINKSLKYLGEALNVDRIYYSENHYDNEGNLIFSSQKADWYSQVEFRRKDNLLLQGIPVELMELVIKPLSNNIVFKAVVSKLRPSNTKKMLEEQNVKSVMNVPIFVSGKFWGLVGLDDCTSDRNWTETEQTMIEIFALTISKAVEKRLSDAELKKQEATNNAIISAIPDILFVLTDDGTILDYRTANNDDLYLPPKEFINKNIKDIMPDDISLKAIQGIKKVRLNGHMHIFEYSLQLNNNINNYEARIVRCEDYTYLCSIRNITARKNIERALQDERNLLKTTLISIGDGVISTDIEGRVKIINKVAENLTGWTQEEAQDRPLEEVFNIINEKTRKKLDNPVNKVMETGEIVELANHTLLVNKDGSECPIEDSAAPIMYQDGSISGVVLVFRDFTEKKKRQEEIEYLSLHDSLTGLYNRAFYDEALKILDKKSKLPLSIIMADVNGLKLTNDAFGHAKGDELLKAFANVLQENCDSKHVIARVGGDEFVVIMPKTDSEMTETLVMNLNKCINEVSIENIVMSVSFGWDTRIDMSVPMADVFKNAEDNMYRNKLSESNSMRNQTISIIMKTLYEKNKIEEEHSIRVSKLSKEIGVAMGMSDYDIHELELAGLMHDIGKIGIDIGILNKTGKLSDNDFNEIRKHSEIGYRILSSVSDFSQIAKYVLAHHERWDGKGYPKGLQGEDIPIKSRIISIADAYDAMTSERAYRKALPREYAITEVKKFAGHQFDPDIAKLFVEKVLNERWD